MLCSAAQKSLCIWDVGKGSTDPILKVDEAHQDSINDLKFSPHINHGGNLLISSSDDGYFKIWDHRVSQKQFVFSYKSGEDSLCVGQFNPINEHIFAVSGDSSGEIQVWDLRMPKQEINRFCHHSQQVT